MYVLAWIFRCERSKIPLELFYRNFLKKSRQQGKNLMPWAKLRLSTENGFCNLRVKSRSWIGTCLKKWKRQTCIYHYSLKMLYSLRLVIGRQIHQMKLIPKSKKTHQNIFQIFKGHCHQLKKIACKSIKNQLRMLNC